MTIRQFIFGKDNAGNVVFRAGKPGFDPLTANIGDLLVDSETQMYQVIASGTQLIANAWAASPGAAGTITRSIALGIGSFSRVALWFDVTVNITLNTTSIPNASYIEAVRTACDLRARVSSGTLVFTALGIFNYSQTDVRPQITSNWFAFRSQF